MKAKRIDWAAYSFMLPAFVIYISVIVAPIFYSLFISLNRWNGIAEMEFIGLQNYINLFTNDPVFIRALTNNLKWLALTIVITTSVALTFAVILNKQFHGRTFFRGFFYFPCVIASIAVAIIWRWVYNPQIGFINQFFRAIGINYSQAWLSHPSTSLYAIFVAALWQTVGLSMILFLAGLQTVPVEVLEAAKIDGASAPRTFFTITCVLMKETFVIVIANLIVAAMRVYDIVQGLTAGGPNNATQMLSTYMYFQTFQYSNVGIGTAIAVLMVLMMLIVIVPYVLFTARES